MTQIAWVALATAIGFAAVDWIAVSHRNQRLRRVVKPSTIALLIAVALLLHPASGWQRWAFVLALLFSMAGDVFLLMDDHLFRAGLAAFLAAHLAYFVGFTIAGTSRGLLIETVPVVAIVSLAAGGRILRSVLGSAERGTAPALTAYLLAISAMVALAAASGRPAAMAGAALFYASDGMIAWNRYVRPLPWSPLPVIVTYHLGQVGLVLSLAT